MPISQMYLQSDLLKCNALSVVLLGLCLKRGFPNFVIVYIATVFTSDKVLTGLVVYILKSFQLASLL